MSDTGTPAERLRAALAAATIPAAVRDAWSASPPQPRAGQLWRARWGATRQLLLILGVSPRQVRTAPVTLSPDVGDDASVTLTAADSDLQAPTAVWLDDAEPLPVRVLDRYLGTIRVQVANLAKFERGPAVRSAADERLVLRARLQDAMATFAAARWAPEGDGTLPALLRQLPGQQLADTLGTSPGDVIALRRGRRPLFPDEARTLANLIEIPAVALLRANPTLPDELIDDLDQPVYRAKVDRLAALRGIGEIDAWREAGYAALAVANRKEGPNAPAWRERLDAFFAAVLDGD